MFFLKAQKNSIRMQPSQVLATPYFSQFWVRGSHYLVCQMFIASSLSTSFIDRPEFGTDLAGSVVFYLMRSLEKGISLMS